MGSERGPSEYQFHTRGVTAMGRRGVIGPIAAYSRLCDDTGAVLGGLDQLRPLVADPTAVDELSVALRNLKRAATKFEAERLRLLAMETFFSSKARCGNGDHHG